MKMFSLSDRQILERIKNGDESMLVQVYKNNYTMIRNFVIQHNGNEEDAEDVCQESVIAFWQNALKSDFFLDVKLSTYLMAIAKNTWFKMIRKRTKFKTVDVHDAHSLKSEEKNPVEVEVLLNYVASLDENCQKLLSYFYFDQMDNKTIAEKMGYANTDTVKSKKYQCFKKLQKKVVSHFKKDDLI
jgi:RNA polymerase sigma factor (sigma-70 family)